MEGADPGSKMGGAPGGQDLEGVDPWSQRGVPLEVRIWKGRIRGPRGGRPWRSGFGRDGSGVPEGGAPEGQIGCLGGTNVLAHRRGGSGVPEGAALCCRGPSAVC